jgi:hyperosmotically inducible periplasmic protein
MKPQNPSQRPVGRVASVLAISALALGLAACGKKEESAASRAEPAAPATQAPASPMDQSTAASPAPATPASGGGLFMGDAGITAAIKSNLAADSELSALKIDVDTANGRVTLKGSAPTAAAAERAVTMAKAVTGVTSVDNQLTVSGG